MGTGHYRTLSGEGHGRLREKASRFIASAFPIASEEEFKEHLARISGKHHDARHVCYAWVLNDGRHRAFDAGEPAGTAGRPILRGIQAMGLTHCAVVVARWFGGTLLGRAGLMRAYGEAARLALERASVAERTIRDNVVLTCSYAQVENVRATVLAMDGEVLAADFTDECRLTVALPRGAVDERVKAWRAAGIGAQRVNQGK